MNRVAMTRAVVLAMVVAVGGASGTGTAAAATPPAANAAFKKGGVEVFAADAVGLECRALGFCDGVVPALAATAVPLYHSRRQNEAVLVTCRSGSLAGVVGFFDEENDDVVAGWVDRGAVDLRRDENVPACGALI